MRILTVAVVTAGMVGCAPAAGAITGEELCQKMQWPEPLPPSAGYKVGHIMWDSIGTCLIDHMTATAPDGHDVLTETGPNESGNWRVTSMSPPAGTMVTRDQPIKMTVVYDPTAPD